MKKNVRGVVREDLEKTGVVENGFKDRRKWCLAVSQHDSTEFEERAKILHSLLQRNI